MASTSLFKIAIGVGVDTNGVEGGAEIVPINNAKDVKMSIITDPAAGKTNSWANQIDIERVSRDLKNMKIIKNAVQKRVKKVHREVAG